jgi:hypothetical protein
MAKKRRAEEEADSPDIFSFLNGDLDADDKNPIHHP